VCCLIVSPVQSAAARTDAGKQCIGAPSRSAVHIAQVASAEYDCVGMQHSLQDFRSSSSPSCSPGPDGHATVCIDTSTRALVALLVPHIPCCAVDPLASSLYQRREQGRYVPLKSGAGEQVDTRGALIAFTCEYPPGEACGTTSAASHISPSRCPPLAIHLVFVQLAPAHEVRAGPSIHPIELQTLARGSVLAVHVR
jgi:hypothetical protein